MFTKSFNIESLSWPSISLQVIANISTYWKTTTTADHEVIACKILARFDVLGYQSGSIRMIPVDTAVSDSNRKYARSRKRHDHITFANSVLYQGDDWMKHDEEYGTWNWKPRNPRGKKKDASKATRRECLVGE
jgi:hypothetical protein